MYHLWYARPIRSAITDQQTILAILVCKGLIVIQAGAMNCMVEM